MAKEQKLVQKIVIIVFLVLVAIGFTVPGIMKLDEGDQQQVAEPRICQTDADCYLMCQEKPVMVLCSQNLCQQNTCTETSYYAYNQTPKNFQLSIEINGQKLNLGNRSSGANLFAKISGGSLQVFSPSLSLSQILEKFNLKLDAQCLSMGTEQYCQNSGKSKKLELFVNEKSSYAFGSYVPEEGDKIKISYS